MAEQLAGLLLDKGLKGGIARRAGRVLVLVHKVQVIIVASLRV
jgi:hypothetical protein